MEEASSAAADAAKRLCIHARMHMCMCFTTPHSPERGGTAGLLNLRWAHACACACPALAMLSSACAHMGAQRPAHPGEAQRAVEGLVGQVQVVVDHVLACGKPWTHAIYAMTPVPLHAMARRATAAAQNNTPTAVRAALLATSNN